MKKYEVLEVEITALDSSDVIKTSGTIEENRQPVTGDIHGPWEL